MGVTLPEIDISWQNLMLTPIGGQSAQGRTSQLQNLVGEVDWDRKTPVEINHEDLARVIDVFINVEDRDVGSVARDIERALGAWGERGATAAGVATWAVPDPERPGESLAGYTAQMRGEVSNMR